MRHGIGYYLANQDTDTRTIQSYLGHNNIQHTVHYTELASRGDFNVTLKFVSLHTLFSPFSISI
ncbi:MAG: tyrosine-type recombinase/integrase [Rhizonema sp. PD37]|nr:tyrosine-type recombinase/integrase [Rhizonema sp. PD37]